MYLLLLLQIWCVHATSWKSSFWCGPISRLCLSRYRPCGRRQPWQMPWKVSAVMCGYYHTQLNLSTSVRWEIVDIHRALHSVVVVFTLGTVSRHCSVTRAGICSHWRVAKWESRWASWQCSELIHATSHTDGCALVVCANKVKYPSLCMWKHLSMLVLMKNNLYSTYVRKLVTLVSPLHCLCMWKHLRIIYQCFHWTVSFGK